MTYRPITMSEVYSNRSSMVWTQKHTHWSVEFNQRLRHKPTQLWVWILIKKHTGEKTASLTNAADQMEQLHIDDSK